MKTLLLVIAVFSLVIPALAQLQSTNGPVRYRLVMDSTITEDCPACGRPTIVHPLRGTFDLQFDHYDPQFAHYRVTDLNFFADSKTSPSYMVTGAGTYRVGGPVALQQFITLTTEVCNSVPSCRDVTFTNTDSVRLAFPLIEISITQTQFSLFSVYTMHLVAAPVREIWFVITNGFTPTNGSLPVTAGDVLSDAGRTVRSDSALLETIGIFFPATSHRVDAFDVAPGGEMIFSLVHRLTNSMVGAAQEGDLLSSRGHIFRTNQQLTAAFGIQPPVPDVGLDAVRVKSNGEILFSIRTNIFAETKGVTLHRGDVLSSFGQIVKSNQQLLAKFHPANTNMDYGLDALYVWPNGEIWFSTETGFQDSQIGAVSDGDLLSTEGIIVYRNAELVSEFAAPQSISNVGLSDVFVVTDVDVATAPRLLGPRRQQNNVVLEWIGTNRVFQLDSAASVTGPWSPLSLIDPSTTFTNQGTNARQFYRLEAW